MRAMSEPEVSIIDDRGGVHGDMDVDNALHDQGLNVSSLNASSCLERRPDVGCMQDDVHLQD